MSAKMEPFISMGKPIIAPVLIPVAHKDMPNCINQPFVVNGEIYGVTCVSFGTPHGAVLVDDVDNTDIASIGASLETHALFPKGASIIFVQTLNSKQIKARLWQQGEGEISFTAEAVCVAMAAANMLQKVDREAGVFMGNNQFHVKWDSTDDNVYLARPKGMGGSMSEAC